MAMTDNNDLFAAQIMLAFNDGDFSSVVELYQQGKETEEYIVDVVYNYIIKIENFDRKKAEALLDYFLTFYPEQKKEIEKNRIHLRLNYTLEDIGELIAVYKKEFGEDSGLLELELANMMRGTVKIGELAQIMGKLKKLKGEV